MPFKGSGDAPLQYFNHSIIRKMNNGWLNIPWSYYSIVCVMIAAAYAVVSISPYKNFKWSALPSWKYFILRWLHTVVWLFLFAACIHLKVTAGAGMSVARWLALIGLFLYFIYFAVFMLTKMKPTKR
ncbi:MAG: hypothetical protein KGO82_03110 [Bacteroidota bacterium]|nr:hypothetical protein [Bacteroidota bacterium]